MRNEIILIVLDHRIKSPELCSSAEDEKNEPEKPQSEIVMDKLHVKATRAVWEGQLIDFVLNVGRTKKTRKRARISFII